MAGVKPGATDTRYVGVGDGTNDLLPLTRGSNIDNNKTVDSARFKRALSFAAAGSALWLGYIPLQGFSKADQPQQRAFGVVLCISILWVTAPVPAFVTALLVPVLVVVTSCLRADVCDSAGNYVAPVQLCSGNHTQTHLDSETSFVLMTRRQAALTICSAMFQPIVLLFLSGFVIAAAIDKHRISQRLIRCVMNKMHNAAHNANNSYEWQQLRLLLALMTLAVLLSAALSNIPTAVLLTSFMLPLLRALPPAAPNERQWSKQALLGIAYACNIGGMTSPIASPQNVLAMAAAQAVRRALSFSEWCAFSLPFCSICTLASWAFLRCVFGGREPASVQDSIDCPPHSRGNSLHRGGTGHSVNPVGAALSPAGSDPLEYSSSISLTPVTVNIASKNISDRGNLDSIDAHVHTEQDMIDNSEASYDSGGESRCYQLQRDGFIVGTILITIVCWCLESVSDFFGHMGITALLPTIVFFGTGVLTEREFEQLPWSVLMLMGGGLALGVAIQSSGLLELAGTRITESFHTHQFSAFSALLITDLVVGVVGNFISSTVSAIVLLPLIAHVGLQYGHPKMFVMGAAIMCSGSMGLPVSSFPNANSFAAKNRWGVSYLSTRDFLISGFPLALAVFVLLHTLGYGLFVAYGW